MGTNISDLVTCGGCGTEYIPRLKGCPFCGASLMEAILARIDDENVITVADVETAFADARDRGLDIANLGDPAEDEP